MTEILSSSFRDPSGFLFVQNGEIYRQINVSYKNHYDSLVSSGLYNKLVDGGLLIKHEEVDLSAFDDNENAYTIIKPEKLPFVSYPYEWSFSQLKDAALATLEIQKIALDFNMTLKDASAYNIQFKESKPILIDTLSFEKYNEGDLWIAYKQFCQHFLAPLVLMSKVDIRLNQLLRIYIDGIPLDMACSLLPVTSFFNVSVFSHIYIHAKFQKKHENNQVNVKEQSKKSFSKLKFLALIDNLKSAINRLQWKVMNTEWGDYYNDTNYDDEARNSKIELIDRFLDKTKPETVWDLGSNVGLFSRLASKKGIFTVSFDIDPSAIEKSYIESKNNNDNNFLPLLLDLSNPSPGIGWTNNERDSLIKRGPADMVMSLALIHHLAISNNVPLIKIAAFFKELCNYLIIEFVPKNDSQVSRLLATREDIFTDYSEEGFEKSFTTYFVIEQKELIKNSKRILYLMKNIGIS